MLRIHKGRILLVCSAVFFLIALVLPTQDRFAFNLGGQKGTITRQNEPFIYWGMETAVVLVFVAFFASGVHLQRKQ